jgi:hypothetical protein
MTAVAASMAEDNASCLTLSPEAVALSRLDTLLYPRLPARLR